MTDTSPDVPPDGPPQQTYWTSAEDAPAEARKAMVIRAKLGLGLLAFFAISMILLSFFGAFNPR